MNTWNLIKAIVGAIAQLAKPIANWWLRLQEKGKYDDELDWLKKKDEWRRKADELREKYINATNPKERKKALKKWLNHLNADID